MFNKLRDFRSLQYLKPPAKIITLFKVNLIWYHVKLQIISKEYFLINSSLFLILVCERERNTPNCNV